MPIPDNLDGAITLRLQQLRGEAPSGDLYEKNADGKYELRARGGEHVMDVNNWRCARCWFSHVALEDGFAPKCAGRPPQPGEIIYEDRRSITVHLWFDEWESQTIHRIDKRGDVSAQWRTVKQMIADHEHETYPPRQGKYVLTEKGRGLALRTDKVKASGEWVVSSGFTPGEWSFVEEHVERISLPEPVELLPAPSLTTTALVNMIQRLNAMMEHNLVTQVFGPERLPPPELFPGAMKRIDEAVEKSIKDMADMHRDSIMNNPSPGVVVREHPISDDAALRRSKEYERAFAASSQQANSYAGALLGASGGGNSLGGGQSISLKPAESVTVSVVGGGGDFPGGMK